MSKEPKPELRAKAKEILKTFREIDEYELTEIKPVIREDGKEGNMMHQIKTHTQYKIDDLLTEEYPDFFALAIFQLYRRLAGEYARPTATPKALDVVKRGSKPDPELVSRRADEILQILIALVSDDDTETADVVLEKMGEYLIAYLTYRSRVAVVKRGA